MPLGYEKSLRSSGREQKDSAERQVVKGLEEQVSLPTAVGHSEAVSQTVEANPPTRPGKLGARRPVVGGMGQREVTVLPSSRPSGAAVVCSSGASQQ